MRKFKLLIIFMVSAGLLFINGAFAVEADSENDTGNWKVEVEEDHLNDTEKVYLYVPCNEDVDSSYFSTDRLLVLTSDKEIYVVWNTYLGGNNQISYRFDDGYIRTEEWNLSKDETALFLPKPVIETENRCDFITKLLDSDRLAVGVTPYSEDRETAVFDLTGLSNALRPYPVEILGICAARIIL